MRAVNSFIWVLGALAVVGLFVALNFFIGLYLISLAVVPATWAYSALVGRSYSFVVDQSELLYRLNRFGQWAWLVTACLAVTYVFVWANF